MGKKFFEVNAEALFSSEVFRTATAEELRVLCGMIFGVQEKELSELTRVSFPRCLSAIALFEAAGVVKRTDLVSDEFSRLNIEDADEESAIRVAQDIRDNGLASLITEFTAMQGKSTISTVQVKKIVGLYTNYALSEEYILSLAAHLADMGKLTATTLSNEAIRLAEMKIDTPQALYEYIDGLKKRSAAEQRVKKLLGLGGRALSKSEKLYFNKWVSEYYYSDEIISEAYDIAVSNTGKLSLSYMDAVLSHWHECGCKTLSECLIVNERDKLARLAEKKKKVSQNKKKDENSAPKYGAFSAEDALKRALERSYGSDDKK